MEVSRLVGHCDTATTETVYRHELRPVIQTGARVIDGVFALREQATDLLEHREAHRE